MTSPPPIVVTCIPHHHHEAVFPHRQLDSQHIMSTTTTGAATSPRTAVKRLPAPTAAGDEPYAPAPPPVQVSPAQQRRNSTSKSFTAVAVPTAEQVWASMGDKEREAEPRERERRERKPSLWIWIKILLLYLVLARVWDWSSGFDAAELKSMLFGPAAIDLADEPAPPQRSSELAVPPLDGGFVRDCHSLLSAPGGTHTSRLERLVAALDAVDDVTDAAGAPRLAYIAEPGSSAAYYLGAFAASQWKASERPFLVAITPSDDGEGAKVTLLTPAFEEGRARLIALPDEVSSLVTFVPWVESASPYATLLSHLDVDGFVLDAQVREFVAEGLRAAAAHAAVSTTSLAVAAAQERVRRIRQVKDTHEVSLMRCANAFTLHAIRLTRARLHFGISESETRAILYEEMGALGLKDSGALILFGENAALPHGSGTDRKLGKSDLVLIDAGGKWGGYVADITRTFALPDSDIPQAHKRVWELVRHAQLAPAALLERASGPLHFRQLDHQARALISHGMRKHGVGAAPAPDYTVFTHRLGHGIGLEGHEAPYVVQGPLGEEVVSKGNVFTLEPGVYVPADAAFGDSSVLGLGVRLEDVFVVHEVDGKLTGEWLTGPVSGWGDV